MKTVSPKEFADRLGISVQAARKAFLNASRGNTWRGHCLPVMVEAKSQGGAGGKVWALNLDAAAPEIQALFDQEPREIDCPARPILGGSISPAAFNVQADRLALIRPILETPARSEARKKAYAIAASNSGRNQKTLANWVSDVERDGASALLAGPRSDKGQKRVLITRKWDNGVGLADAEKQSIADRLALEARSMIANDGTSRREVARLSEVSLQRLSAAAGSPVALSQLAKICRLNDKWAKPFEQYRVVHMHHKDHKRFQDKNVPRIRRELHEKPMGLLMGDVHYMDILVEDAQEPIRVRMIAWMDMASMFIWVTPVFLSKGQSADTT